MSGRSDGRLFAGGESTPCPTCDQHVENTLDAFCGHWVQSSTCEGPPRARPGGLRWVPGGDWAAFAAAVHAAPSLSVLLDTVAMADGAIDTDALLFLDGVESARDGDNPWLDVSGHDEYLDCPACGKETYNERDAFYDHWVGNRDCPGPMAVTIDRWRRLGVDVSPIVDATKVDDPTTTRVYEAVDESTAVGGNTEVYPDAGDGDGAEADAGDPGADGRSISYCPHCGANVEAYDAPAYCPQCGEAL
jgi:endogenous inhibitor of DNA gyrase (YacG/DUF329 family)